ncbi:uncharacterized protein E0L32_008393 [Thyridium curvatum]|uniref:Uncharacterized protein n=1 Tax=Thyridium curvatum TaxID=1093900 RepID=A0A507B057_9PEZI|nr:uncharacterized protein E0L32_008393 [Thyridium curvatum]TPX10659.1 hypothetical protein E0L32_008393 [Thyridium curvatum]
MSAVQADQSGQRSSSLTINLSSNNPFRNRAASPSSLPLSPASPFDDPPPRPVSRNPFLDPGNNPLPPSAIADAMADKSGKASPTAEEIFVRHPSPPRSHRAIAPAHGRRRSLGSLTLDDKKPTPPPEARGRGPPPRGRPGPPRGENMPPPGRRGPPNHRPTRSQEEALRARRPQGEGKLIDTSSPPKRMERRPRRNSESSVVDKPMTEEEKKARELRRRERERRHRDNKDKPKGPNKRMDIIDQLDATSIFGTGVFHHDGPFDALNPHRNRKGSRRAPMQAFPKDSLNNVIGGSGPLNKRPDHATFMGRGEEEAFKEYSQAEKMGSSSAMPPVFDPLSRGSVLHGDESMGLGTSTFLEGTPAARTVIQRREAEKAADIQEGGLQRKKSLAQRIRNINRAPRDYPSGRMTNPESAYGSRRSPPADMPMLGGSSAGMQGSERNPFFEEFDSKKGEDVITVRRTDTGGKARSPSSPPPMGAALERRATTDATQALDNAQPKQQGGGLLARVKSLKGGRRARGPSDAAPPPMGREA